jgi:hypothetical protein
MGIKQTLDALNAMEADGVIGRYAIAGAVAAYNYVEPAPTEDPDIIIAFEASPAKAVSGLVSLEPIYAYLKQKGFATHRKEGILIGEGAILARRERPRSGSTCPSRRGCDRRRRQKLGANPCAQARTHRRDMSARGQAKGFAPDIAISVRARC